MADNKALIELIYDSDLETECFGFTDEGLQAESHESVSDSDSKTVRVTWSNSNPLNKNNSYPSGVFLNF